MKRARLRPLAESDLVELARHYAKEGGFNLGERVFDAADRLDVIGLLGSRQDIIALLAAGG